MMGFRVKFLVVHMNKYSKTDSTIIVQTMLQKAGVKDLKNVS